MHNAGTNPSQADANFDGIVNVNDFAIIEQDMLIPRGERNRAFSDLFPEGNLDVADVEFLFVQEPLTWDSTAFTEQLGVNTADLINGGLFTPSGVDESTSIADSNVLV